ncbi:unnamed protein product [Prorocentrum cordatum]|uniref:Uncharacterized protein n=1 Tax=Prorocentrum cordatum TaxID=2364126 RepID=A0ABN9QPX8_9DINO|nr:unnamed protein product [Polarella glacialis]
MAPGEHRLAANVPLWLQRTKQDPEVAEAHRLSFILLLDSDALDTESVEESASAACCAARPARCAASALRPRSSTSCERPPLPGATAHWRRGGGGAQILRAQGRRLAAVGAGRHHGRARGRPGGLVR